MVVDGEALTSDIHRSQHVVSFVELGQLRVHFDR